MPAEEAPGTPPRPLPVNWIALTRRTNLPKLRWLIHAFKRAGIQFRINGQSFHAPILQVLEEDRERAWKILTPVDDLLDDDPIFENTEYARAWWLKPPRPAAVRELAAALGILAKNIRKGLADQVQCVPPGEDHHQCPYHAGTIPRCPAGLWSVCRPMIRLEAHLFAVAKVMATGSETEDDEAIGRAAEIFERLRVGAQDGGHPLTEYALAFCHVLGLRMSEGRLGRVVKLSKRTSAAIVQDVMRETVVTQGTIVPRRAEIVGIDVIERDAEDWNRN